MSRFLIGNDTVGPTLLCERHGRQTETKIRFMVVNGMWDGVLDTETGVLKVTATGESFSDQRVMDFGPVPAGDYQEVLIWAKERWLETANSRKGE
jgi:hypothetical protein